MKQRITEKCTVICFILFGLTMGFAQEADIRTITGTVIDQAGEPLPGVNVIEKGTSNGTITDLEGEFSIRAAEGDVLSFSFIGQETQEIEVGADDVINVAMRDDDEQLDDVVVVGYGEQKREHLTGSVETVDMEEIEDLPVGDLGTALSGRLLGAGISGGSTRPGSEGNLTIRNPLSFTNEFGSNTPLYVIDGVMQITGQGRNDPSRFNSLDASEVESITILKDASAAVYGARAANGVVIVTTKRGKEGKPRFSYSGSYGVNDEAQRTEVLSAYEFGQYYNILNGPYGANADPQDPDRFFSQDELEHFRTIDHNWLDRAWSSSATQRHTLNASGGTEDANFFGGASYYTQDGNLGPIDYDKWTFRAGSDVNVAEGFKAGIQVSGNFSNLNQIYSQIGGENIENDYSNLLLSPRYIPPFVDGLPVKLPGSGGTSGYHFFELQRLSNISTTRDFNMTLNLNAEYEVPFVDGLKASVRYGRNMGSERTQRTGTSYELYDFNRLGENGHIYEGAEVAAENTYLNGNEIRKFNTNTLSEQLNFTMTYDQNFGKHGVNALVTMERAESESASEDVAKSDPLQDSYGMFSTAFGDFNARDFAYESGSLSYIGRFNYQYDDKYLFEFLYRTDASTKFAPENYWGDFYSVSAGWILSKENFFNVDAVDFLKVRYSLGLVGKDDIRPWLWRQRYSYQLDAGAVFGGNSPSSMGMKMEASPNRAATWSDDMKNNLGIDARFLDNRLSSTLEFFYNKGTNMLVARTGNVPFTVGGSTAPENFGEVNSFGYEVAVGWDDRIGEDFRYGLDVRFSWSDNRVEENGNFNDERVQLPWVNGPGESSDNGAWGYDYLGMFQNQQEIDAYVNEYNIKEVNTINGGDPIPAENLKPGMLYYRDVRGEYLGDGEFAEPDGIINENDQIKIGDRNSNLYGFGSTIKLSYKSLSFQAVIAGSFGGFNELDGRDAMPTSISSSYENVPAYWNDIYDPDLNPQGQYPNPFYATNLERSNFWERNALSMAVRNFNLSYTLPKTISESINISNAKVTLTGLNPIVLYNPFDYRHPQGSWSNYPVLRTFSLGVNLTL